MSSSYAAGSTPASIAWSDDDRAPAFTSPNTKGTLVRALALAKLRDLRREGMSYREIGVAFGRGDIEEERPPVRAAEDTGSQRLLAVSSADAVVFLRTLNVLDQGLAFFTADGTLVFANAAFHELTSSHAQGTRILREVRQLAGSLAALIQLGSDAEGRVQEVASLDLGAGEETLRLKGSYIGYDLFSEGSSILVSLERTAAPRLSAEQLCDGFGLTRKQARIAGLLMKGLTNARIADLLTVSPHTVRHHVQNIFERVGVRSRLELAARLLRTGE